LEDHFNCINFKEIWKLYPTKKKKGSFKVSQFGVGKVQNLKRLVNRENKRLLLNINWSEFLENEEVLIIGTSISNPKDQTKGFHKLEKAFILLRDTLKKMKKHFEIKTVFLLSANFLVDDQLKKEITALANKSQLLKHQKILVDYYNSCSFGSVVALTKKLSDKCNEAEFFQKESNLHKWMLKEKIDFDKKYSSNVKEDVRVSKETIE